MNNSIIFIINLVKQTTRTILFDMLSLLKIVLNGWIEPFLQEFDYRN